MISFNLTWQAVPGIWGLTLEVPFFKITSGSLWPVIQFVTQVESEKGLPLKEKKQRLKIDRQLVEKLIKNWPEIAIKINGLKNIGLWFLKRIKMREFKWISEIGTGEAGYTGVLVGTLWSVKSTFYCLMQNILKRGPDKLQLFVAPNFCRPVLVSDINCIFDVTCGHIIIGGFKMLWLLLNKKRGQKRERPSH